MKNNEEKIENEEINENKEDEKIKENEILDKFLAINEVEEVKIDDNFIKEQKEIMEKIKNPEERIDDIPDENGDEYLRLASENEIALNEKKNLTTIFKELDSLLNEHENVPKSINEVYEIYLENEFITKSHIREKVGNCLLKFSFFFIGPLYGIIFLIGIFQMKSLLKSLGNLIVDSGVSYYKCNFRSNCNITINGNETSVYDFYEYFYTYSKNETIDFNLMLITAFIGTLILKLTGFKISTFIFSLVNFPSMIWLLNFNFDFSKKGIFDYDLLKILNIVFIYLLLFIGIGSSTLISHQILVESHLKYKKYLIEKIREELNLPKQEKEEMQELKPKKQDLFKSRQFKTIKPDAFKFIDLNEDEKKEEKEEEKEEEEKNDSKLLQVKTMVSTKTAKDILNIKEEQKQIQRGVNLYKREKNKFDFFFMICLITILGYLGKYSMNFFLDFILEKIFGEKYDKRYFLYATMISFSISLIISICLYQLFKITIFEYDETKEEKEKIIKICQVCGYLIYSEKKKPLEPAKKNCCVLCCESFQNCCTETFCKFLKDLELCDDCDFRCTCSCCQYDPRDYNKKIEKFCYCYKTNRKSYWCNKFMTNKTQQKIFPYMLEYFLLQLTTIGFEKQYEKYKNIANDHRKTWLVVFISTFVLYFYFTLSFAKMFKDKEKKVKKFDLITKLSNEVLGGTHGILLFNAVFSLIFSSFYLSYMSDEVKDYLFRDNLNIIFIPILMNKFYYFTLNYYCIYQAEKYKKFDIISNSSLISIYIAIWNLIITVIKSLIPEQTDENDYNYKNVLYIIQIVFSSLPSLVVVIFIVLGLICSSGIVDCCQFDCDCQECKDNFKIHQFLFCIFSFLFCCGGCWIKMSSLQDYEYDCCNIGECCDIGDNKYCSCYCINNVMFCDCCFCNRKSNCYLECCYDNCDTCDVLSCCNKKNNY